MLLMSAVVLKGDNNERRIRFKRNCKIYVPKKENNNSNSSNNNNIRNAIHIYNKKANLVFTGIIKIYQNVKKS